MKLSCAMAEDLFPLYLEEQCSQDSRAALEEHLAACPSCRDKLASMDREDMSPEDHTSATLAAYGKKIRRRRIRIAVLSVLGAILAAVILTTVCLTALDMHHQSSPAIYEVEPGVWNLTGQPLEVPAENAGDFILYTNNKKIEVSVQGGSDIQGNITLWDEDGSIPIQYAHGGANKDALFTNLTAARRYRVTCDGLDGVSIIISEGRHVTFWNSLQNVSHELTGLIFNR